MIEWPIYKKELLTVGNRESNVGLCTLWTEKEKVLEHISKDDYLIAGQCYSRSEGPSFIIRHALANKKLRYLILIGADLNHSADALLSLKENGLDKNHHIIGIEGAIIDKAIPFEAVNNFRKHVDVIDKREYGKSYSKLEEFLKSLPKKESWGEPEVFPYSEPEPPEFFPSEATGFVLRGRTVAELWPQILHTILRFGYVKKSQYSDDQKELVSLKSIITDEDPEKPVMHKLFPFDITHLEEYKPQLLTSVIPGDTNYTYGSRLRDHNGIDQIKHMIEDLKKTPYSRRAVAVTWNVENDHNNSHCPCLDLIQALVQDKLHLSCYIRSNDMYGAWPENALALRAVQKEIADAINVPMGNLIIDSNSAHIYSSMWEKAETVVKNSNLNPRKSDPRGNILLEIEYDMIKIKHLSPEGKPMDEYSVKTAKEAMHIISTNNMVSQPDHALDVGSELAKAEIALTNNIPYVQDKPLKF